MKKVFLCLLMGAACTPIINNEVLSCDYIRGTAVRVGGQGNIHIVDCVPSNSNDCIRISCTPRLDGKRDIKIYYSSGTVEGVMSDVGLPPVDPNHENGKTI